MQESSPIRKVFLLACAVVAVVSGIVLLAVFNDRPAESVDSTPTSSFPLPAFTDTPYRNLGADAKYLGSAACAECHRGNHDSYKLTAHSRALATLDPAVEPPDAVFRHQASGRTYRVYRQAGQFRHEEVVSDDKGKEIARVDLPIKYLIGSGNFCRSYLVEVDGFLHESPLTWYTARKEWGMSPGYDFPQHHSFERPISTGCLNCHAGRVETVGGSGRKHTLHEHAIGCERCHGPGSLHAEGHRNGQIKKGAEDWTIVQPAKLSRPLLESICAECHLNGVAAVSVRGRLPTDFRPGRPLTDYRVDYKFDTGSDQMTVVGHIEQLRQSACYQKSNELTCITCHDPHAREKLKDPVAVFREQCLNCHADKPCSLAEVERRKKQPADNCVACHMPRGDTDIPHIAFTHHRIGRHVAKAKAKTDRIPKLEPIDAVPNLSQLERQRSLGLAYRLAGDDATYAQYSGVFHERARTLLEEVRATGLKDPETAEALASLYWRTDVPRTRELAVEVLNARDATAEVRGKALLLAADCEFQGKNYKFAASYLEELVATRRFAEDWRLLGLSYMLDDRLQPALTAMQRSYAIRPTQPNIQGGLFEIYRRMGDNRRAQEYLNNAQWLERNRQQ